MIWIEMKNYTKTASSIDDFPLMWRAFAQTNRL